MNERVSSKNTKKEILEAYEKLLEQTKEKKEDAPDKEPQEKQKSGMVEEATSQQPDKIMKDISGLKISLSQSLDKVEEALIEEHKKLSEVSEAIRVEKENLKNIYQIKAEADFLEVLINTHKEKKHEMEQEMKDQREAWEKEKKQAEQELKEDKERISKERAREEEEYLYHRDQKRKKEEDSYNEKMLKQEKELKERREAFEKEIREREADIKASEDELQELREKAEQFPAQLEEAVQQKEKEITVRLTSEFKHEKDLLEKEYQSELKLKDQTIKTLQDKIRDQDNMMKQLYSKVENADKNVKDIVLKAIENSGRYSFVEKATDDQTYRREDRKQKSED